jgi:hypothetical protein
MVKLGKRALLCSLDIFYVSKCPSNIVTLWLLRSSAENGRNCTLVASDDLCHHGKGELLVQGSGTQPLHARRTNDNVQSVSNKRLRTRKLSPMTR